jgi:hypothetical protein
VDAAENLGFYALGSKNFGLDWSAVTGTRTLRSDEPPAVELTAALKQGEVDRLRRLLAANPGLAHCVVENAKGGGRTPLHLFADWPGHNSNAVDIVRSLAVAGADLDAPPSGCGTARRHYIGRPATTTSR